MAKKMCEMKVFDVPYIWSEFDQTWVSPKTVNDVLQFKSTVMGIVILNIYWGFKILNY